MEAGRHCKSLRVERNMTAMAKVDGREAVFSKMVKISTQNYSLELMLGLVFRLGSG